MPFQIHPRVAWQVVEGEAVLMDLEHGRALGLNRTGSFLWSRLADHSEAELVREVVQNFETSEAEARADVGAFLDLLRGRGFIEP